MQPNTARAEAERWLGIAAKMLASRDLVGSRSFAIRGREADPTNPISEQIIAIVDTLIAAEKRVTNSGHHDWYSILQVSHLARDLDLIASQYRRLFLLLNPDHNHFPFADYALRAVADAWSVLSDPSKKWMYDSELSNFLQRSSVPPPDPEPVRVDSSAASTYQFFNQSTQQQQQQWIHHLHQPEQPQPQVQLQERQLFQQQQHHHHQAPPQTQSQHQWLPQTQLQQLLPEHQQPSQPQWLPQSPQSNAHQPPPQQQQQPWMPEQQQQRQPPAPKEPQLHRPAPQAKEIPVHPQLNRPAPQSKESPVPPQLQRPQPQIPPPQQKQKQTLPSPPPPQPPAPPPVQTPPFQHQPQGPPQQQPPQQPLQPPPQELPQEPVREEDINNEKGGENGNNENDCNETGSRINDDNDDDVNDDDGDDSEQVESFWTPCPYCYYLYEYPKTFEDCTLRCQNCRRAFQAIPVPGPPGKGGAASFCSWGFFPIGFSMTSWKRKNGNNGLGSNWMPFSPMFACPVQQKPKTKVWEIVDEDQDEDEFNYSDSSDDPDSSDDWGSTKRKGKKRSGRRGRPRKKTNTQKEKTGNKDVANGEIPHRASQRLANHDVVNIKSAAKQMGKSVRGRKKLDLNVEFSNEVEDHAPVRREGNNGEEVVEFFEGLDEFLSTLPILHVVGDEKTKAS